MSRSIPTAEAPLVSIEGVRKRFGANEVLKGVSAEVKAGEILTLIGPSGSGKTTLLRCVNFLERYDGGRVVVDGHSVGYGFDERGGRTLRPDREIAAARAEVGMVFQSFNLFPHLNVLQNIIAAPMKVRGERKDAASETAMALLRRVGLEHKAQQYPFSLSGGQQQRVAIVRALAMKPRLLLMDEVTSALDPQLVGEVLDTIAQLATEGMTMIITTHEMEFARQVSSQILFMTDGAEVERGTPQQVFEAPRTPQLQQFLERYSGRTRSRVAA
jgi:polar amino acid transport system ATP-binding protein